MDNTGVSDILVTNSNEAGQVSVFQFAVPSATLSLAGPGSLPLLIASLPLTVVAIAAWLLGTRLQKRMSPAIYTRMLRATLVAFVVLLIGQAAIELAHRSHIT